MDEAGCRYQGEIAAVGTGFWKKWGQRLSRLRPMDFRGALCYSLITFSLWALYLKSARRGFSIMRAFPVEKEEKRAIPPLLAGGLPDSLQPPVIVAQGACLHLSSQTQG